MTALATLPSARWPVGFAGACFLVMHGLLMPALVLRARKKFVASASLPPKASHFTSTLFQLTFFAAFAVIVAGREHVPLFPPYEFRAFHLALALLALALAVGFMRPRWKRAVQRGSRLVHLFSPENSGQRLLWIGVSLCAGIGEELTYRGVLTVLLTRVCGNFAVAALVSAALFGVVHMVQGWRNASIVVVFALGFQALAYATGSLYVAMFVHVVYDLIAGYTYGRLVRAKREREASAPASTAT
jgi:membrane protease YdiL (CAAX protease family)